MQTPTALCDEPWLQFTQPDVRDLAFSLACPPILSNWPSGFFTHKQIDLPSAAFWQTLFDAYIPRLHALEKQPQPLIEWLQKTHSNRLGLRFEALLSFWLHDASWHPYTLLGQNIQLWQGTHTVGEVDFVVLNRLTQAVEHWEVTLKFYLGEADLSPANWYGLNKKDTLHRKLRHTIAHQFNTHHIVIEGVNYPIDCRRAIVKGRLFYPKRDIPPTLAWLTPKHLQGTWGTTLPKLTQGYWQRATRAEWLIQRYQHHPHSCPAPAYRTNGLYFAKDTNHQVVNRHMLRLDLIPAPRMHYHAQSIGSEGAFPLE